MTRKSCTTRLRAQCFCLTTLVLGLAPSSVLAQSIDPNHYVLIANRALRVGRLTSVATGNVAVSLPTSQGGLPLMADRLLVAGDGTFIVSDAVDLRAPSSVYALFSNSATLPPGVVVRAPCGAGACAYPPPVFEPFFTLPAIIPGTQPVTVPSKTTITLAPGDYSRLRVRTRGTVVFTGGTYNLSEIKTGRAARLLFTAPTTVNVAGRMRIGNANVVGPIGPNPRPQDILFNVGGDTVTLRPRTTVSGRIFAPSSFLRIYPSGLIKGQLVADEVRIDRGVVLQSGFPIVGLEVRTSTPTVTQPPTSTSPPTATPTQTLEPSPTETLAPTATDTPPPTDTPVPTTTDTPEPTPTETTASTPTATNPGATSTPQATATSTATPEPEATATDTPEPTATSTDVPTATHTATATYTVTVTNTASVTQTATSTKTPTRTRTATPVPPTSTPTTACSAAVSVGATNYEQVSYVTQVLGGTVNQIGGTNPGGSMTVAADFQGTVGTQTGISVALPTYLFASSVVAFNLTGSSEPGNVPSIALGAPTDTTFTTPGNGGPDGTDGDGSLVMSASGNFLTLSFGSTICASPCEPRLVVIFTDTAGSGTVGIELLSGGVPVGSASGATPGGAVGSAIGGMSFIIDGLTFDQVRISRLSGTVEIDGVAVKSSAACGGGGSPIVICGDGNPQGGEECDDGNGVNGDGCSADCRNEYEAMNGSRYCTLSQGGWGGAGGEPFLARAPEILPVTIGGPGFSTAIHTEAALQAYLPHGGSPAALFPGERDFHAAGDVVDDGSGTLGGQTAALALAVSLSQTGEVHESLGSLTLPSQSFCTQGLLPGDDALIGTTDDIVDGGSAVSGPWSLPANVVGTDHAVADLLLMANQYLRGSSSVATISEVNSALDTMNNAFDACRQVVACP